MSEINKKHFACNSAECYLNSEFSSIEAAQNKVTSCQMCSFTNEDLNKLKEEIKKEFQQKRKEKFNNFKTRFLEYTIGISAGALFLTYVFSFVNKIISGG